MRVNPPHYESLRNAYQIHSGDSQTDQAAFHLRVFNLLARYDALGGPGYQAAIPKSVFNLLKERLGVSHECFASPLNRTLDSFGMKIPCWLSVDA